MDNIPKDIDDIVSPSDKLLLDLLFDITSSIKKVIDIFSDRNSDRVSISLRFAMVALIIETMFGLTVNTNEVIKFIASLDGSKTDEE